MAATTYPADLRQHVAEFAATYPTPNVRRAVQLAQAGTLTWEQVYDLFKIATVDALAVAQESEEAPESAQLPLVLEPAHPAPHAGLVACPNGCGQWVMAGVYIDPDMPCS